MLSLRFFGARSLLLSHPAQGGKSNHANNCPEPQILFLDVQMPDIAGFQVLTGIDGKASPLIVFVTAFDRYAVRAFEFQGTNS
jgi:two-component system, LytTR family, response regulator